MRNLICRADIYTFHSKLIKSFVRWGAIICAIIFPLLLITIIPVNKVFVNYWREDSYRMESIIGVTVFEKYYKHYGDSEFEFAILPYTGMEKSDLFIKIIRLLIVIFFLSICPAIYNLCIKFYNYIAKKCYLELYEDEIIGVRAKLFSKKTLKLPIEKIDSVSIEYTIINKIIGGPTVVVCSASGKIKFNWVQNAQEFMDKVVGTINTYKESKKPEAVSVVQNDDNIEWIFRFQKTPKPSKLNSNSVKNEHSNRRNCTVFRISCFNFPQNPPTKEERSA